MPWTEHPKGIWARGQDSPTRVGLELALSAWVGGKYVRGGGAGIPRQEEPCEQNKMH